MEKETIELVKKMIEDGSLTQEAAEKYCPELIEYNEDKKMKEYLIRHFELKLNGAEQQEDAGIDRSRSIETYKKTIAWIKKKINSNQWQWKPSKEQMNALEFCIRSWGESGTLSPYESAISYLNSLLVDLKKL